MAEFDFILTEEGLGKIINGDRVGVIINYGKDMLWIKRGNKTLPTNTPLLERTQLEPN